MIDIILPMNDIAIDSNEAVEVKKGEYLVEYFFLSGLSFKIVISILSGDSLVRFWYVSRKK